MRSYYKERIQFLAPRVVPQVSHHEKLNGVLMGNIRGLYPLSHQFKVKAIEDIAILVNISIIALTESHLSGDILDGEIKIEGYICHRSDRVDRTHRGIITYIKSFVSSTKVLEFCNSKCEAVGVLLEKCHTLLINVYRPPNCSEENVSFEEYLERVQLTINDYSKAASNIVLYGDFNFEFIQWPDSDF